MQDSYLLFHFLSYSLDIALRHVMVYGPEGLKNFPYHVSRRKGKYLTAHEKRKLGLCKLPKTGLVYEDFRQIHQLWLGYMNELLPNLEQRQSARHPADESLQMRVCRADLHGALVKVTRSNVASQVGTEGFVAMETKNTFQILTKDNEVCTCYTCSSNLCKILFSV